jgi:hypothetical protein
MSVERIHLRWSIFAPVALWISVFGNAARGASVEHIVIDGSFADWNGVPSYLDPLNDENEDYHGDPPPPLSENPDYPDHADVDILEYKFAHDKHNLYAYFKARGEIGNTQRQGEGNGRAGRYYVIVTIDVDNNDATGYELRDGGYWISPDWPLSSGYDMNMEIEFYNGEFNTGHYINHAATAADDPDGDEQLPELEAQQQQGIVDVNRPGSYDYYTQWVMWGDPASGEHDLGDGTSITFVEDRGPVYQGLIRGVVSPLFLPNGDPDGFGLEMVAPFIGFMSYPGAQPGERGEPIMALGRTLDIAFSLEHSGEMVARPSDPDYPVDWASDTAAPIIGYYLGIPEPTSASLVIVLLGCTVFRRPRNLRCRKKHCVGLASNSVPW